MDGWRRLMGACVPLEDSMLSANVSLRWILILQSVKKKA